MNKKCNCESYVYLLQEILYELKRRGGDYFDLQILIKTVLKNNGKRQKNWLMKLNEKKQH